MISRPVPRKSPRGYALLDVVLAMTIFAISITSLVVLLQRIMNTSNAYAKDRLIQRTLETYLSETKRKPVQDMNQEYFDELLEVTFRSEVEQLQISNADGDALEDLYKLMVTAEFEDEGGTQTEVVELFIYQPEDR